MKLNKEKTRQAFIAFLKKFWQNLYLILIVFLILDLIFGALFFWRYYLNREEVEPPPTALLKVNQALLNQFIVDWETKEAAFEASILKEHSDPFRGALYVGYGE